MAELLQTCSHNPCPICGDASARCQIDEYGYIALCYSLPAAKIGDLTGTWLCYRQNADCSQWKDQRVALEARYREQKIRLVDRDGQPLDLAAPFDEALRRHREQGGEA